jgi:hypothetical protein
MTSSLMRNLSSVSARAPHSERSAGTIVVRSSKGDNRPYSVRFAGESAYAPGDTLVLCVQKSWPVMNDDG